MNKLGNIFENPVQTISKQPIMNKLLFATLFLFLGTKMVFCLDSLYFQIEDVTIDYNQIFTTDVIVNDFVSVGALQCEITWDDSKLEYIDVPYKGFGGLIANRIGNKITVLLSSFPPIPFDLPDESVLLSIQFRAIDCSPITIDMENFTVTKYSAAPPFVYMEPIITPSNVLVEFCALPVAISEIAAQSINLCTQLLWQVEVQENTRIYHIQRSTNGLDYSNIGNRSPEPWEGRPISYEFDDCNIQCGKHYYYRLKIEDYDNTVAYSDLVSAKANCGFFEPRFNFNNPVGDFLFLQVQGKQKSLNQAVIFDTNGRMVLSFTHSNLMRETIDVSALSAGLYLLIIDGVSQKFIKM